jgi:O-antigen/teichoic acid export membrane protein
MSSIRRAVAFSVGQRYIAAVINFLTIVIISRLLTPTEIGISATVSAILVVTYALREFATPEYLIARKELTAAHVRSAFTVMFLLTIVVSVIILLAAKWIAAFYNENGLIDYLHLAIISMLLQVFVLTIVNLLRRDMSFDKVAMIDMTSAITNSAVTICLASVGFSYMSFAWGLFSASAASAIVALSIRPDFSIFRPLLREWRGMLSFGAYHGANTFLYQLFDSLPSLLIGRLISFDAVGLYNRAVNLSKLPDKVFFDGIAAVVLPAFSAKVRERPDLTEPYLKAVEYITGMQWPALAVLAILAYPIVSAVLGNQWIGAAPLVQIIALGWMFSFSFVLNYGLLQSIGALRDTLLRALIAWPVSAIIISVATFFGLTTLAFSYWITIPLQAFVAFYFVKYRIDFRWRDLLRATQKSAIVTASTAAGPLVVVALSRFNFNISIAEAALAVVLSMIGWIAGLWLARHPLFAEIQRVTRALTERSRREFGLN